MGDLKVSGRIPEKWQPRQDSNLNKQNQNLLCYRYTTELYGGQPVR